MSDFISSFQCFVGDGPTGVVFGHQRAPQRSRPNVTPEKVLRRSFYSFFFLVGSIYRGKFRKRK